MTTKNELCYDQRCILVVCNQAVPVSNQCATIIQTLDSIILPNNLGLEIKHHIRHQTWRIVDRYYFPITGKISFSILTTQNINLQPGQILCHLQTVPVADIYKQITGNTF